MSEAIINRGIKINTSCEKCIFALRENGKQYGCKANRLDKFPVKYDKGSYWFIENRICNLCRQQDWVDYMVKEEKLKENPHLLDCLDLARDETKIKILAVIYAHERTEQDIIFTLKSLELCLLPPKHISIIIKDDIPLVVQYLKNQTIFKWSIVKTYNLSSLMQAYQEGVNPIKDITNYYYWLCTAGDQVRFDLFWDVDVKINEALKRLYCIKYHNTVFIFSHLFWALYGGLNNLTEIFTHAEETCRALSER